MYVIMLFPSNTDITANNTDLSQNAYRMWMHNCNIVALYNLPFFLLHENMCWCL